MSNFCYTNKIICEDATSNGYCSLTACRNVRLCGNTIMSEGIYPVEEIKADWSKKPSPWYTGTPPKNKEGWCLIMVMVTDCDRTEFEEYEAVYWRGDYWDKRHKQPVVKWQPIDLHEKREREE